MVVTGCSFGTNENDKNNSENNVPPVNNNENNSSTDVTENYDKYAHSGYAVAKIDTFQLGDVTGKIILSSKKVNQCGDYESGKKTCYDVYMTAVTNDKVIVNDVHIGNYDENGEKINFSFNFQRVNANYALTFADKALYGSLHYLTVFDKTGKVLVNEKNVHPYDDIQPFEISGDTIYVNAPEGCPDGTRKVYTYKNGTYTSKRVAAPSNWEFSGGC